MTMIDGKKLTPEIVADYIKQDACSCPWCGSADLNGEHFEPGSGCAYQPVCCGACNKRWQDSYELVGVYDVVSEEEVRPPADKASR